MTPRRERLKASDAGVTQADVNGHVYFVSSGKYVKIGFSTNWRKRLNTLQATNPEQLTLEYVHAGSLGLERALHQKFKRLRVQHEWFRLEGSLARYISERHAGEDKRDQPHVPLREVVL